MIEFAAIHGFRWPTDNKGEDVARLTMAQSNGLADAIERGIKNRGSIEAAGLVSQALTQRLVTPSESALFPSDPRSVTATTIDYWKEFARFARVGGFSIEF
jgi:hypothetical protein